MDRPRKADSRGMKIKLQRLGSRARNSQKRGARLLRSPAKGSPGSFTFPKEGHRPWLRHYSDGAPKRFSKATLSKVFEETAKSFPKSTALIYFAGRISYAQLL